MSDPIAVPGEFAAAMQQLSAEAAKSAGPANQTLVTDHVSATTPSAIEQRLQNLEAALIKKMEEMITTIAHHRSREVSLQFRKIEEQLDAIRNAESVHQRLFDSLHDELIKYRDNFVHESLQK